MLRILGSLLCLGGFALATIGTLVSQLGAYEQIEKMKSPSPKLLADSVWQSLRWGAAGGVLMLAGLVELSICFFRYLRTPPTKQGPGAC